MKVQETRFINPMATYTAKDITVLQGLEPVRKRPGMYIGGVSSHGLHHLIWEILDNSVDEAMNGFATSIQVTLHADGSSITISDDGRGIPVDRHPRAKKPALEVIFTTLHAGGKFEGQNYKTAGGLHGVGGSVVNALSSHLVATVKRDGHVYEMTFKAGKPVGKLRKIGRGRGSGTTITFHPDPKIFPKTQFNPDTIRDRLETTSYLHKGLRITYVDEVNKQKIVFEQTEGIRAYLSKIVAERKAKPVTEMPFVLERQQNGQGTRVELVLQWTESTDEHLRSYVNGIPTGSGGSHENGFRSGLGKAVRNYVETHKLAPKGVSMTTEDIREGLIGLLSVFITDPQFQGQTKDRLNNPEVQQQLDQTVRPALEHWLNQNRSAAEAIVARIILASRAREASRAASAAVIRKTATKARLVLPGKLSDCTNSRTADTELFIVEGDSAGGFRQTRPRPGSPGGAPAARQGLEYRAGLSGQGAREQGACRSGASSGLRAWKELRARQTPLPAPHSPRRCRRRRTSHHDAPSHFHLPPHARAHRRRAGLHRPAPALPHRYREGNVLGGGRCGRASTYFKSTPRAGRSISPASKVSVR